MTITTEIESESGAMVFPLSPLQEGMLFNTLYASQPGVDIAQIICDWQEEIDGSLFSQAWQQLAERHSILRTSFSWEGPESPRQQVHERLRIPVRQKDWRGLPTEAQAERLEEFLQADRRTGFELTVPPLMRVTLIRLGHARYQFVWTMHHLIVDGRSVVILLNDLFAIYQSLQSGQELQLKPAPAYREYIDWLQEQDWSEAERFWRGRLEGFTTPTSLPMRGCGSNGSPPGGSWAEEETLLTEDTIRSLRELGKAHGLTLNTFLQGAWGVVLSRYSGEEDVVFGAVKACRHLSASGAGEIAGPLINTLPVRVRCAPDQNLIPWLRTLREQWMELRQFEHSPLARVQSWSQVPAGHPLFETILNVLDPPWDAVLRKAWSRRAFRARNQPNYPLALDVYVAGSARLTLLYDAGLFERPAMRRMLGHVRTLLESMASAPDQRVGDLPLLSEAERIELLKKWNDTAKSYPAADCVHRLFEAQVTRSPEALAISSGGVQINYRQLNERANRVAHRLRRLGVGSESRVGICMERSAENVIGLLGILKADAAYVPLDPEYPTERLAFMIADAKLQVLLTQQKLTTRLAVAQSGTHILCLDEMASEPAGAEASDPPSQATLKNLAYVIYTSGSTGTPKGVEIEHQGLLNLVRWHQEQYQVRPEDRATQLASLSFDASVWELWPYLTAGASVHVPDEKTRLNPDKLVHWLAEQKINLTFLPTPLAEAVMDCPWPEGMALRVLLTGGDRLRRYPRAKLPFQLVNHYGPTENSVVTTATVIEPQREGPEAPPIGRPIANTHLYILDRWMKPVPVGVPGELYIAGAGLARGYLNQPQLTAEKFTANPFSNGSFSRFYRTGDLVRYREDGNVEFLGRIDQQVKLRGFRIELGEIEAVLSAHVDVTEAVVVACEDGETRLAAYVVAENGKAPAAEELRDHLKQKLPEHMVPSAFVFLDALPLTPNGKVDRKALPAPDFKRPEKNFVAPRNPVEEVLAGIWCELLHLKRVGVHDNFFELGGHSLLATQVVSRVRNAFAVEVPLQAVFEQPTVEQFARALKKAGGDQRRSKPVARTCDDDSHGKVGLSFAQERLWFLEELEPGLAVYNVPMALVLQGKLDIAALERSLNELATRHGSLRTSFGNAQGQPKAQRLKAVKVELPVVGLESLSSEQQQAEMERVMAREAAQPFDLGKAPLLRTKLLRLGSQKHVLLLTTHHIVTDGWSMAILYQELRASYEAHATGKSGSLPELPLEFDDYARWQREWLQGEVMEEQLAFWKRQLRGPLPVLDLPTDHRRPAQQSYRGKVKRFALPNSLCAALKTLCRREDVTLFMLLLGAFQTLLHRYSGQDEIITGTTVAGRTLSEIEDLVGLFLNTLALRTDMSGNVTFRGLLQRVRKVALEAYMRQDAPFEKVVETLGVERDLSRSPVFQAMFILQKAPLPSVRAGDLEWNSVAVHSGTSKFDLTLSLEEESEGLSGYVEYNRDLFEPNTVSRMLDHFQTLLEAVVANPDQKLWELPLLTAAERQQVLVEWNSTRSEFPRRACIHDLFEEQVERTPNAVAVSFEEKSLTYRELNLEANRLAHHLQGLGVGPDVVVGLCVERSLEMLIGLLAILKAGGAYLPMDPAYPTERLAYMVADSRSALLITQKTLAARLEGITVGRVLLDEPFLGAHTNANPTSESTAVAQPGDPAYVIYTSGSTGKPKGVVVPHRAVVNFLTSMAREPGLTADDVLMAVTTLSFDIAVLELLLPLTVGARVVIANHDETVEVPALGSLLEQHRATVMQATPVTWRLLLEAGWKPRRGFKALVGGEALPKDLADQLLASGVELWNMYGPTETTVWSTCARIIDTSNGITIGKPIANTTVRILDAQKSLCPIGVPGELCIGGDGVALGYWNRPELTALRFIPDPSSTTPGARLYCTGDRARWRHDGTLEHLGRLDFQVKLRGFRIELGEIEAGIAQHPAVREVAVIAREDTPGDKRLVAYLVAENAPAGLVDKLRALLRAAMPEYMVPAHFVMLQALPRTHNGKLDRKALPAPEGTAYTARGYEGPLGEIETTLAQIWSDVLKVERVGRHDHFFDLGGHSLLAIKTVSRIRDVFEVDLPTRTLFEKPILADLAKVLTEGMGSGGNVQRIEPRTQSGACALSFAQERFWLLHQLAPASPAYNIVDVIRLEGTYEAEAMRRALKELVRRHEILRTAFTDSHEQPMQTVLPTIDLMLSELDLSALPEQEREGEWIRVVRDEGRKPFDLSQAPLLRGTLVHLSPQEHRLLLTLHHIIADEWSMEVLHQEVNQLYAAFSQGQPSPLPELPVQYADFACWQRDWLQGDVRQGQLAYWKDTLAGAPSLLELPTDKPRPAVQSLRGATETFALPKDLVERLKALGRQHQATLFMTLEAGFAALLHRYTGQEDILVGTPMSGRPHSETERLIGCFINTVVLRAQFTDDLTFRSLLHQVRERALGAYAHPDLPFEHLVAELAPERDPSRTPLFQVMFTLYNSGGVSQTSKVSGIRELETGTSKFDLTLSISETKDGLEGIVEYSTDLFEAQTIRRLYGHYGTFLEEIARDPEQRISKIPMLAASERHQILNEWNNTASNYPKDECLHHLFEKMAKQAASRTAVEFAGQSLTYGQLNAKANRLANCLVESGVTPDSLVGIYLERSLDLIVGLLAILKAGAAYVPMDPSFPPDRLAYMMNNAGMSLLVTQSSLLGGLPLSGRKVICLDAEWETIQRKDSTDPNVAVRPSNLAYTIYTSGSTGEPKGVMIEHGSVVNFLVSMQREPGFDESDVLVAVTTISFDIAALEIFLPLISGGKLVLASRDEAIDGSLLLQRLRSSGATTLQATPATWKLMLEAGWEKTPALKMLCGGEAFSRELANRMLARGGELWNMYGPTETTIWSAVRRIEPGPDPVLIGPPIANTQLYIVDKELEPVPIGVAGELLIGGDGLSRGYLNRPELTAERFIENPFSGSGSRVYRTGDLARFRSDGGIEFLGRLDFQVKVRGYRIELGEIESVLTQHAGAKDAVAMTWEDRDGDKRLVAYYIPKADRPLQAPGLGKILREKLPDYMIPSWFVEMEAFPLTPNGKIDRKALPAPSVEDGSPSKVAATPQTVAAEVQGADRQRRHSRGDRAMKRSHGTNKEVLSDLPYPTSACIHAQIEEQAQRTPERTALVFEDTHLSYRALNERANRLAARLIELGVGPDRLVGVHVARSINMVIAALAVLKAGGAYVALDPDSPAEHIRDRIKDAGLAVILTQGTLLSEFGETGAQVVFVDDGLLTDAALPSSNRTSSATATNAAYVIYTSGSNGRPKGVRVEHGKVVNFLAAMDSCIRHDPPGTWLAVTRLSSDISVLELFWTLARGFKVVIQGDAKDYFASAAKLESRPLGFSLFLWGNDDAPGRDKYRLMLEGAKYFDRNGFEAVWTPERHFHAFGGPYPNPSVTAAALAAVTERISIRAGSCVSPLHHPIRIAEEWAVVDNLSNGRVALAFASGWQLNDFVLRPENHANNKRVLLEQIDQVRRLWRGEKIAFRNPLGQDVAIQTLPRPVQPELPLWVTTSGNPDTYRQAGELGANVLTHLLGQSVDEVGEKIAIYRQARAAAGHEPSTGRVTLMLHTFVGKDDAEVRELVRQPMKEYLRSSLKLVLDFAWSFPAFKRPAGSAEKPQDVDLRSLPDSEIEAMLDFAFERYFETSGLFGTPSTCARMLDRCQRAGVDEIACLLDFGVPTEQVMASLPLLNEVREEANSHVNAARGHGRPPQPFSIAAQIERHRVTHLQCTPSLARMLLLDRPTRAALARIQQMLVGGEALPTTLTRELQTVIGGDVRNSCGPTETTVWSTTHPLTSDKIRGYHIELGEIESVLAEHPDVRQAAVHLWTLKADDVRIVACCVPAKAGVLAPIKLRKHLRARLPEYMIPQYFLPVEEIPLTPNGKVDRSKLPTPAVTEGRFRRDEAPADPIEATIAEIWTKLIHPARPIGRNDRFFEMGGHSLLGLQALRQMEKTLGVKPDFRALYQESLADIATRCRSERIAQGSGDSGAARPVALPADTGLKERVTQASRTS